MDFRVSRMGIAPKSLASTDVTGPLVKSSQTTMRTGRGDVINNKTPSSHDTWLGTKSAGPFSGKLSMLMTLIR